MLLAFYARWTTMKLYSDSSHGIAQIGIAPSGAAATGAALNVTVAINTSPIAIKE
jgi:hypothetical protein